VAGVVLFCFEIKYTEMSEDTFIDIVVKSPKERKDISISSSSTTKEVNIESQEARS
jgi:hypothetical protein